MIVEHVNWISRSGAPSAPDKSQDHQGVLTYGDRVNTPRDDDTPDDTPKSTMNGGPPNQIAINIHAKIRSQHPPAKAQLVLLMDNSVRVNFDTKQRAITPGQSAVFYEGDILLGGGLIGQAGGPPFTAC